MLSSDCSAAFGASLAAEVRPYGIDVLVFHPSPVATRFYDKASQTGLECVFAAAAQHQLPARAMSPARHAAPCPARQAATQRPLRWLPLFSVHAHNLDAVGCSVSSTANPRLKGDRSNLTN